MIRYTYSVDIKMFFKNITIMPMMSCCHRRSGGRRSLKQGLIVESCLGIAASILLLQQHACAMGDAPPPDTTAPSVQLVGPSDGRVVRGFVSLIASVSDDSGMIDRVEFVRVGSSEPLIVSAPPYKVFLNTTSGASWLSQGSNQVFALAFDWANNAGRSATMTFIVDNTPPRVMWVGSPGAVPFMGVSALEVSASDNQQLSRVEFWANERIIELRVSNG